MPSGSARFENLHAVRFGDRLVRFRTLGPAAGRPAVVLLHGGQCTSEDWASLAERLADRYRLVIPDGFAEPLDPWLVWQLLEHLGIARAALVGHSAGGRTVRAMVRLQPERVWALVAVDSDAAGALTLARKLPNDRFSDKTRALYEQNRAGMMKLLPQHRGDYPSRVTIDRRLTAYARARMTPEQRDAACAVPAERIVQLPAAPPPPQAISDTGKFIPCPTLVIQTGRGKFKPGDFTAEWAREHFQAEQVTHVLIPEAGHWPWLEDLDGFRAIFEPFLAQHAPSDHRADAL